jgi:hypothetical protein
MRNIIVTTPKNQIATAAEEAQQCLKAGGGSYFRTFRSRPAGLGEGSRIYYVQDGYVRGYGVVSEIVVGGMACSTTGKDWGDGYHAIIPAVSWTWIKPLPMKGFQGWRYFVEPTEDLGGWRDPMPEV